MNTLNDKNWQIFWDWAQGMSYYKLSLREGVHKTTIRDICMARIVGVEKLIESGYDKNAFKLWRKVISVGFINLDNYKKYYKYNKEKNGK